MGSEGSDKRNLFFETLVQERKKAISIPHYSDARIYHILRKFYLPPGKY